MIKFSEVRTKRIAVELREMTIGEEIDICKMPESRIELTTTAILKHIASPAPHKASRNVSDPRLWSIEERAYVISRYLSQVTSDEPDFKIGELRLSNYLDVGADLQVDAVEIGRVGGHDVVMRPLLGVHAEALEVHCKTRADWMMGAMACQISKAAEPEPDILQFTEIERMEWVLGRINAIRSMPASEFDDLLILFVNGKQSLFHFFRPEFADDGVVWECLKQGEGAGVAPARFLPDSCVGEAARVLSK